MPDLMSQKVLWKILYPMVHSIVDTPGSSFLARNGEARRWSYSNQSVWIMLTDSSSDCLVLFFLLLLLFFFLVMLSLRAGTTSVDVQEITGCGSSKKTSPFYPCVGFINLGPLMDRLPSKCSA